ncbi:hypothetical protein BJ742DRAFT_396237 [Cladochytrium replicatum]|nr:hypothetical protein BJ742DRAFT_396237 [Cladochytrium replicatum]
MRTGGNKGDRSLHLLHRIIPQERDADMGSHFLDLFNESVDDHCEDHDLRDVDRETRFTQLIKSETNLSPNTTQIHQPKPSPSACSRILKIESESLLPQLFTPSRILTQKPPMTSTNPKPRCRVVVYARRIPNLWLGPISTKPSTKCSFESNAPFEYQAKDKQGKTITTAAKNADRPLPRSFKSDEGEIETLRLQPRTST